MSKEKVHLREKVLAKGMIGFYLDYSVKVKRKQETIIGLQKFVKAKDKFLSPPWPAWTAIGIAELGIPGALVEIRVVANLAD